MTDWALEEAIKMAIGSGSDADGSFTFFHLDDVVEALRAAELRGRVAGMTESALIANDWGVSILQFPKENLQDHVEAMMNEIGPNISEAILEAASKLSPTT